VSSSEEVLRTTLEGAAQLLSMALLRTATTLFPVSNRGHTHVRHDSEFCLGQPTLIAQVMQALPKGAEVITFNGGDHDISCAASTLFRSMLVDPSTLNNSGCHQHFQR